MYKFKSPAAGDLIMLEPNGKQILQIIGKLDSPTPGQGILLPEEMPGAIDALQRAIVQDEQRREDLIRKAKENGEPAPRLMPSPCACGQCLSLTCCAAVTAQTKKLSGVSEPA